MTAPSPWNVFADARTKDATVALPACATRTTQPLGTPPPRRWPDQRATNHARLNIPFGASLGRVTNASNEKLNLRYGANHVGQAVHHVHVVVVQSRKRVGRAPRSLARGAAEAQSTKQRRGA